jgi:cell division initiation protein
MFTPQQIEEVSFSRATFGGYDMQSVDEFLGPLTDDYIALYKENALLKNKMRVLVAKLEEYRSNEASMKQAIIDAQSTCDTMVKETEAKCAQMLSDTSTAAAESSRINSELLNAENEKLEAAKREANERISAIEAQLKACLETLAAIKEGNLPTAAEEAVDETDAVADEISHNLENLVGTTEDTAPKAEPKHPSADATTTKFANLQFGRNYDPTQK